MLRPVMKNDIRISQREDASSIHIVNKNGLEIVPSDVIRTWSRDIRTSLKDLNHF